MITFLRSGENKLPQKDGTFILQEVVGTVQLPPLMLGITYSLVLAVETIIESQEKQGIRDLVGDTYDSIVAGIGLVHLYGTPKGWLIVATPNTQRMASQAKPEPYQAEV